jgi:hypothetical protein
MDTTSRHQEIGDIQSSGDLQELIENGRELIGSIEFSRRDLETIPELVQIMRDVNEDLTNGDPRDAYTKLDCYFTTGPLAQARTEEDLLESLSEGVPGAYAVDTAKYVDAQIGLHNLYEKFKKQFGPIKGPAPQIMYR